MTDWIIAGASLITAFVAIGAYRVAKAAPKAAAKFADEFRSDSIVREERQRLRTNVLISLLRGRRQLSTLIRSRLSMWSISRSMMFQRSVANIVFSSIKLRQEILRAW